MSTLNFNHSANRIHIESDIKINLTVQSADNAEDSHSFNCIYPDRGITFSEFLENGTIHIKLTKTKSLLQLGKKEWDLTVNLAASDLDELKLDVANANLNFVNGSTHDYVCNMASGTATMNKEFKFKNCCINGAMANLSIMAPRCFENLEINLASGQTTICFPASENVVCEQKSLFKSVSQLFGKQTDEDLHQKHAVINGAIISNSISTY